MGRPLKIKYSGATAVGVQEMSDADISDLILPLVVANWSGLSEVSGPSGSVVRSYSITPPSYNFISRGVGYNTETDSIGTHPRTTSTTTYTVVQNEFNPGLSATSGVRPIQQSLVGNEVKISAMTNQDIINDIMPVIVDSISTGGQGAYYLGLTSAGAPATGTWVAVSNLTDNYYNSSNVYQSIQYTLWLRTSGGSVGTIRPLTITNTAGGETRLTEMTNSEVEQLASFVGEYIRTTGIGKYSFSVSAPGTGTWISRGSFTDTVNNLVDTAYVGVYIGYFTGAFTGAYTSQYTGSYVGYYTGIYSGVYSGTYQGSYVGAYAGAYNTTYDGSYVGTWTGSYTRNFTGAYTGDYMKYETFIGGGQKSFVGYYQRSLTSFYGVEYTAYWTGSWTRTDPTNFTGQGTVYTGTYARYVYDPYSGTTTTQYYAGNYASTIAYTGTYVRYRANPDPYVGGTYVGYYSGGYAGSGNFTGNVNTSWTGIWNSGTYTSSWSKLWTSTWAGTYTGSYTGLYTGVRYYAGTYIAGAGFASSYAGGYNRPYTGSYTRAYSGSYSGAYTGIYAGSYAGSYAGAYAGAYVGTYASTYIGYYNNSFSQTFTGSYSGLTVQSAVTTTTYQLWVRTA